MCLKNIVILIAGIILGAMVFSISTLSASSGNSLDFSNIDSLRAQTSVIGNIKLPEVKDPQWLTSQIAAEEAAKNYVPASINSSGKIFTYSISTKGSIVADIQEFKIQANQTLNDARGWSRMSIGFQEVESGGNFTLVLSEASQLPSFAPSVCSIYWSCQVGRNVIINQDRWLNASDAWNGAGGSLRDYRHMVVNHETGHWLGHGHLSCSGTGQVAPIMQQQSISLQGCGINPWPLANELWTSRR